MTHHQQLYRQAVFLLDKTFAQKPGAGGPGWLPGPHLLLQGQLLQGQLLVLRGLRLARLPLLLAQQLLLKLLLLGGACSLPCSRHCSQHQLRLEALLLATGAPRACPAV